METNKNSMTFKRFVAMLLTAAMIIGYCPTTGFDRVLAEEQLPAAIDQVTPGQGDQNTPDTDTDPSDEGSGITDAQEGEKPDPVIDDADAPDEKQNDIGNDVEDDISKNEDSDLNETSDEDNEDENGDETPVDSSANIDNASDDESNDSNDESEDDINSDSSEDSATDVSVNNSGDAEDKSDDDTDETASDDSGNNSSDAENNADDDDREETANDDESDDGNDESNSMNDDQDTDGSENELDDSDTDALEDGLNDTVNNTSGNDNKDDNGDETNDVEDEKDNDDENEEKNDEDNEVIDVSSNDNDNDTDNNETTEGENEKDNDGAEEDLDDASDNKNEDANTDNDNDNEFDQNTDAIVDNGDDGDENIDNNTPNDTDDNAIIDGNPDGNDAIDNNVDNTGVTVMLSSLRSGPAASGNVLMNSPVENVNQEPAAGDNNKGNNIITTDPPVVEVEPVVLAQNLSNAPSAGNTAQLMSAPAPSASDAPATTAAEPDAGVQLLAAPAQSVSDSSADAPAATAEQDAGVQLLSADSNSGAETAETTETDGAEDLQEIIKRMVAATKAAEPVEEGGQKPTVATIILKKGSVYKNKDFTIGNADENDTTFDGITDILIKTEDAEDDDLAADGSTVLNLENEETTGDETKTVPATMTIRGINVILKGLRINGILSVVNNAKLNYSGTKADDTLNVTTDSTSTVTAATGEGNDTVNITGSEGTMIVDAGDGDDSVMVTGQAGGNLTVNTGEGNDTLGLMDQKSGTATADTGDGDDNVIITTNNGNSGSMTVDTGAGEDNVTATLTRGEITVNTGADADKVILTDKAPEGKATIDGGDGDDTIEMDVQTAGQGIDVNAGGGDDTVNVVSGGALSTATGDLNQIKVNLGEGINNMSLNISLGNAVPKITINGEAGNDQLHITGKLKKLDNDEDINATGNAAEMKLTTYNNDKNEDDKVLTIVTNEAENAVESTIESITDDLENKRTKKLTPVNVNGTMSLVYNEAESFTNYVINAPSSKLKDVIVHSPRVNGAFEKTVLSNVIIDTDTFTNGDNKLVITDGAVVDARGLKLVLKAKDIEVNGILAADLVQIEALDGTGMYSRNFKDQYDGYKETENFAESAFDAVTDLLWDMVNIKDEATVTIGEKGGVYSLGDVIMLARVEQAGTLITTIPVNAVNVKLADATIDIKGDVKAGVIFDENADGSLKKDANGKVQIKGFNSGHGSVRADAQVKTTTAKRPGDGIVLSTIMEILDIEPDGYPIGVTVVNANAEVNVAETATIEAAKDISLASKSEVNAITRADSGLFGAPFAIAAAILLNDASTTVAGKLDAHTGDVRVEASADIQAKTVADKGKGQKSKSGGYVAVSVVLQDALAKIADTAEVNAGGKVIVDSKASEKVTNVAASSEQEKDKEDEGKENKILTYVKKGLKFIVSKVKDKITKKKAKEKMEAADKKLTSESHNAHLDDNAQKNGEVSIEETEKDNEWVTYTVQVAPWDGYKVKSVTWRGFNAGDSEYTTGEASETVIKGVYNFETKIDNVYVFVEYEEDGAYEPTAADLFDEPKDEEEEVDFEKMLEDLGDTTDDQQPERELNETGNVKAYKVSLSGVLTYETEEGGKKCLEKVLAGDKVRVLPNPPSIKKKLAKDGLKVTYYVKGKDGKNSKKTVTISADSKGRYFFTVPEDAVEDKGISFSASFEDAAEKDKEGDEDQNEAVGAIGVVVASNDSRAVIDYNSTRSQGATVTAGKDVEVKSTVVTDISNKADGTTVGKKEAASGSGDSGDKKTEGTAIKRADTETKTDTVEAMKYGLIIDETINGSVAYSKVANSDTTSYRFEITPTATQNSGYSVSTVLLTYISEGKKKTKEIKVNESTNKYIVDLADSELKIDAGTTAHISVSFAKEGVYGETLETSAEQAVLEHAIKISYNKQKSTNDSLGSMGTISYSSTDNGSYVFSVSPADSFKLENSKLTAKWTGADGTEKTAELTADNNWKLDATGIPAGATITVSGKFVDDVRDFKAADSIENGSVKLYDEKVKKGDKPQITVTPNAGYSVGTITVKYKDNTGADKELTLSGNQIEQVKKDGKPVANLYQLKEALPDIKDGTEITVSATFAIKSIGIYAGESDNDNNYTLSEKNVAVGDTVTVKLSDDNVKAGKKIGSLTVEGGTTEVKGNTFTVKDGTSDSDKLTVKVILADKDIELKEAKLTNGTVTPQNARADSGETVTLSVKPDKDYKVKKGTMKVMVVITAKDNSETRTEEVLMTRQNDTTYTFRMPNFDIAKEDVALTFQGEFEPGVNDSTAMDTSLGASVAVTVVNSESRSDLKGKVTAGGDVSVTSDATGIAKTETKAGYSKGNTGIGGAVTVQVASIDSKALIYKSADLKLDGKLNAASSSDVTFDVNADASGTKEAKKTGVGAGIAVAVNGSDSAAAVQDGAKLDKNTKEEIAGISVTASQKAKDTVNAKAGASGGTAVVPVAAVDVTAVNAQAYLGKVSSSALKLTGDVSVSASVDAEHNISADASATGKGAGVGAAIVVSVVFDEAEAKLNQSVEGNNVTVTTETTSKVKSTATAGASGGKKEEDQGKSPDKQADSLLGGAANLAGKNKSTGINAGKINNATKDRQKAETDSGTVGVAGAIVVNVQSSESVSEVQDGVDITAKELAAVTSLNGTTSIVKANASTTNSDNGVGVGVGLNIVFLDNIARIGNGAITADKLNVAARTKMTEPEAKKDEAKKEEEKVDNKDDLAKQLGEKAGDFVNDLVKETGLDGIVSADLLGKIVAPVVTSATNELIKASGLDKLLGDGDFDAKLSKAKAMLEDKKDGLMALPGQLLQPLLDVFGGEIDLNSLTPEELEVFTEEFLKQFEDAMLVRIKVAGGNILSSTKDGIISYMKKNAGNIFSGVVKGEFKKSGKKVFDGVKNVVTEAVKDETKNVVMDAFVTAIDKTFKYTGNTGKSLDNLIRIVQNVKNVYQNETLESIYDKATEYVTKTFKENVFDYEEMMQKVADTDFKKLIVDGLKKAAKAASVTLGNEVIGALSDHFDLSLQPEEAKATGHVIETQGIAGAGARDVGVAGSVAITVLNSETSAKIADGGAINVGKDMNVAADEIISVKNTASAAVDAKGNASDNKSAANKEEKDVGGGNDAGTSADCNHVSMKTEPGASLAIRQGDKADVRPNIYVTVKDGYKLPEKDGKPYVTYTYKNKDGDEVTGTLELEKVEGSDNQYVVKPMTGALANLDDDVDVALKLEPEEILNKIAKPEAFEMEGITIEEDALSLEVKGREQEEGKPVVARVGETVQLHIKKAAGRIATAVGYSWIDKNGTKHDVELNNANAAAGKEKELTLVSSNADEYIYSFTMPDGEISDVIVQFEKGEEQKESETKAKDENGKSVGVGAAFSIVYGGNDVTARIGKRTVTAGEIGVTAEADHRENISSVAGSDPVGSETDVESIKKTSVDASIALNILDMDVKAAVDAGATLTTKGYSEGEEKKDGDLTVSAKEDSRTETTSSAFAVGGMTAVGATVAVNIALTSAKAEMAGSATVAGSAAVSAASHVEDVTKALASAMGADIARNLNKLNKKTDDLEEGGNKLLDGSYVDEMGQEKKDDEKKEDSKKGKTDTGDKINKRLDQQSKKQEGSQESHEDNSTSSNVMRTMGVKAQSEDAGSEGTDKATDFINDKAGTNFGIKEKKEEKPWQVAAAVGVTVANHEAETVVGTISAGGAINATAENSGNFNTLGTASAVSQAKGASSIAAGVAVTVNDNTAKVSVNGDLTAAGDLTVASKLTQNLDGEFAGKLAAQALSGAVSGKNAKVSIGGAISFVWSEAESTVDIAGGTSTAKRKLEGDNITVEATDKSKLGARAGGLSLSKGASVGMGIGSATVVSNNTIRAAVGEETSITGSAFKLNAEKQAVTYEDYNGKLNMRKIVSDSSKLSNEERENADTGLIDLHKGDSDDSYKIKVNLSSDNLLEAADTLNILSGQNTYVEAIAGSVMTGQAEKDDSDENASKLSLAGSFAVAVTNNKIAATLGKNAVVTLTKDMALNAKDEATTRIIAGSFSAAPAKASVGATVAVLVANDNVKAETGSGAKIEAEGDFTQNAETKSDIQLFTAAMAVAAGTKISTAAGGAINVIISRNTSENTVGANSNITSKGGSVKISSATKQNLMAISGSANVTVGKGEGDTTAAGGTINVIYDNSKALTTLGDSVTIKAAKDAAVISDVQDQLISGTASVSVAASKGGTAGAGVINFMWSETAANTKMDGKADVTSTAGDIDVAANNDAWMLNATLSVAGGTKKALGAGFNVNVFKREATAEMGNGSLNAGRDVNVRSSGRDTSIMAALGASAAAKDSSMSGTFVFLYEENTIGTAITKDMTAKAARNAILESYFSDFTVGAAGNIAISAGGSAYGVTSVTAIKNNSVTTDLGTSTITAKAGDGAERTKTLTGEDIKGIFIGARAEETQFLAGAGIAASSDTSLNGVVAVLVNNNTVEADAGYATLNARADADDEEGTIRDLSKGGSITVTAKDDTRQTLLAGGLNLSASGSALGAAVVTLVSNKTVDAKAHDMHANNSVNVTAENSDKISTLAVSAGGSGSGTAIEIGVAVQILKSRANAIVGSTVTADTGDVNLKSVNNTTLLNVAGAIAGSGGGAAAAPVGAITYFQGESNAYFKAGSTVTAKQGSINIATESKKDVSLYTLGVSASSGVGLSGAANILVSKDKAYAGTEHIKAQDIETAAKSTLKATGGRLNITADNDYRLRAISGAIGVGGSAAIGVNAVVSVLKSSAIAELSGDTTVGHEVNVIARANRDVLNAAATLAAGQASGGITVMVLAAGTKMSQDAADMVMYGNSDSRDSKDGFDAAQFMKNAETAGVDMKTINADEEDEERQLTGDILAADLEGNGHRESEQSVGSRTENEDGEEEASFDGASGYRSNEIDVKANDTEDEDNRGESMQAEDTEDVANAKKMNTYVYEDDPDDAVIARIMANSTVSADSVNVRASQGVAADLIGAGIAVGQVGIGVSTVVAILRSNVLASSDAHITKAANGVTVKAESKSGSFFRDEDGDKRDAAVLDLASNKPTAEVDDEDMTDEEKEAYEERKKKAPDEKKSTMEELKDKFTSRNIRAFSMALGAGEVGLAVSVAVVLTDNVTEAILGGTVENAGEVNVEATHNYGSVMAATGALAAGGVAVGASVAVAQANGTVKALIRDGAVVKTNTNKDIKVITDSSVGVDTFAVTAGAGMVSVNAGIALSFNRLNQETGIGAGTTINSGRDIVVDSTSDTTANSHLLGVSVGGVAVALNAAVSDVAANINTHIGGETADSTITATRNISVTNNTTSSAIPKVLAVAAGGVAVGGNVLLAFNDTKATAAVTRSTVSAADMTVSGDLSGSAKSDLTSITAGLIAVGVSVNYADMRADNRATVTDSAIDLTGSLNILTGSGENNLTIAEAHTISGNIGLISVGVNAAIARNNTRNYAILEGAKSLKVGKNLTVHGAGASTAIADMTGFDVGALSVALSAVVALNDADARTQVDLNGNVDVTGKAAFNASQNATTTAKLKTGGGSVISAKVSAAMAYGRANSLVNVKITGEKAVFGSIDSDNDAVDQTTATIDNMSFDIISAAARFAAAYSQDVFQTKIILSSQETEVNGNVNVKADNTLGSTAVVTPSTGGVEISLAKLAVNASIAKNTAGTGAYFETIKGNAIIRGDLNVIATGKVDTDAEVKTATISIGGVSLGANIAKSDLSVMQAAYLRVGGVLTVTGKANVQSIANEAIANAKIGASGGAEALSVDLAHLDVSRAIARENMSSTAAVLGGPIADDVEYYYVDEGEYVTKREGWYDYELVHSGFHVIRDANGVAKKENVTMVYYDTGEYQMINAINQVALSTFKDENNGKRKETLRFPTVGDMMRYDDEYFEWVEEDVTRWVEKLVRYERPVDIYNPDDNKLTAASLNIESVSAAGTKTGATARTDGAKTFSIATAGSLDAKAYSTDSFGVMFEGMTAEIAGAATLKAETNTVADAKGSMPGSLSLVDNASSEVTAQVGKRDDKQSVAILIGQGNNLIAKTIEITAHNYGSAAAWLDQGTSFALGKVKKSTQPTESWYNTAISIGSGASLKATEGDITIISSDVPTAESVVNSTNIGLLLNFNNMMGKNNIDQENNIDIGNGAKVTAKKNVNIKVDQHTIAKAETVMKGGGILEGSTAKAQNTINRVARINIGTNAAVTAEEGGMTLQTASGASDNIRTNAWTESVGLISLADAKAYSDLATYAEINVDSGATLKSKQDMTLEAVATSYNNFTTDKDGKVIGAGVWTQAVVDAGGLIPLPQTVARNTLLFRSYINLNRRPDKAEKTARPAITLESEEGGLLVNATNEGLVLYARTKSVGKGLAGTSNANSWNDATLTNAIWIDDANITGDTVRIFADNGSLLKNGITNNTPNFSDFSKYDSDPNNKYRPHIISDSFAQLMGIGKVAPDSRITGEMINQIRSHDTGSVIFTSRKSKEVHKTTQAYNAIWQEAKTDIKRTKVLGIALAKNKSRTVIEWGFFNRCDFCGEGTEYDVSGTAQDTLDKRYDDLFKKILSPINDIQRMVNDLGGITKARYGEEDYTTASKKFVLDVQSILGKDVTLSPEKVKEYRLWTNTQTYLNAILLPNATRLYTSGANRLQYVVDVINGDLFNEERNLDIEIITALTKNAFANPVIPIGSTGSLDLRTGMLTLPDQADYELFLHEVSGKWLLDNMKTGFMRTLIADPMAVNAYALEGGDLPSGTIEVTLSEGEPLDIEGLENYTLYWIGATPGTATDPDQTLIGLLINEETDEIDAFRTSQNMLANDEIIDVSLYLYRDSKADREGVEKYNVMFFDTPEGEDSLVKVVTSVLADRKLETPLSMKILLRARYLEGADMPVYTLTDHAFVLCDGTDGIVDLLDGYHADFDGDTFDSNYTRIEGIRDGNPTVTIKEGQPVWPEWTGEDTAEDIEGTKFRKKDGQWEEIPEDAVVQANDESEGAA